MDIFASLARRIASRPLALLTIGILFMFQAWPIARPATPAPSLPAPTGTVVKVSTEAQLQSAISKLASNTTIVLAPGTYKLTSTLYINGTFTNVGIRGGTDNRDDVVLIGPGMTNANYGNTPYGIWTGGNVNGVLIANLTVRDLYYHPIIFNGGTQSPRVYNVHLIDAGQQFVKSNPNSSGVGAGNGVVEYSVLEYTTTSPTDYTNGVDVHGGANWIIRHNLFKNITASAGLLAGPAVLVWNHSSNTITEGNTFLNCARGIAYGMSDVSGNDHTGGIIRNNFFYRSSSQPGDIGIQVVDSPNTQVLNNTVFVSGTYGTPIEYRYTGSTGVVIANNLLDGIVHARDGATGTEKNNVPATASMFVSPATGDLHLKSTATSAIDRGVALANVVDDFDGNARPNGAGYDVGADESGATATTYSIAGHVRDASNAAVSGVTMTLGGARSATATTDASGAFSFASLASGGDYTVTPSKTGYSFTPAGLTYGALASNQSAVDFSAAPVAASPTVSLTAPASGASLVSGAATTVSASAAAATGHTIASVSFYAGSTLIGTDTTSPYSVSWTPTAAGSYSLTAAATDNGGSIAQSAARVVTVTNPAPPPAGQASNIWSASATAGAVSTDAKAVEVGVKFRSDSNGYISGIRFYKYSQNSGTHVGHLWSATGSLLGSATFANEGTSGWQVVNFASPIAITANTTYVASYHTNAGHYALTNSGLKAAVDNAPLHALADSAGGGNGVYTYGSSSAFPKTSYQASNYWVDVVFTTSQTAPPSQPPASTVSVTLTAPSSATSFTAPATVAMAATASTSSGTVSKVEFYNGNTLLGTDTVAPFTFSWGNVAAGSYALTAVATNSAGVKATSTPVGITVKSAASTVTVNAALTAPSSGSSFTAPASIALSASAAVSSGTVSKVEFYNGSTLLATATASPYKFSWSNVAAGSYTLSARATASGGATATSAPVSVSVAPAPGSAPSGRINGLTELCTFNLPAGTFGGKSGGFEYGGSALTYVPGKGTLLLVGHVYDQMTAEITIPGCGGTATVVSNFTDLLEGKLDNINPSDPNPQMVGGHLVYNGKLYISGFSYYDGAGTQVLSHFIRPLDASVKGQVSGPFRAGPLGAGFYSGYMTAVPADWQAALGGPALTGNCCTSIISRTSYGPSISSFDPEHLGTATELVGYDQAHQNLGQYSGNAVNPVFNGATRIKGVVFPPGTSSVIFTGRTGLGAHCYGEAAACGDPANPYKGEHAYPYTLYAWAYDANDLAAVKAGTKQPYDLKPYATWTLPGSGNSEYSGASTYDPTTGRIYVVEESGAGAMPVIHVFTTK